MFKAFAAVTISTLSLAVTAHAAPTPIDLGSRLHDLSAGSGGQVLQLDINGDGANDLGINYFEFAPGAQIASIELIGAGRGLSDFVRNDWPDANLSYPPVGPSGVITEIPTGGSVFDAVEWYNPSVDNGGVWAYNAEFLDPTLLGDPSVTFFNEAIVANREFYFGFKFRSGANLLNYGWVRARFDWDANGPITEQWTILAAAYESTPFVDILAGDSGAVACPADLDNGSGTGTADGGVDINDLLYFLGQFESGTTAADLDNGTGTGTPDGGVDINDLLFFLSHFEAGC